MQKTGTFADNYRNFCQKNSNFLSKNSNFFAKIGNINFKLSYIIIDLPDLLTNIDKAIQRQDFHHTDYYAYLDLQRHSLKTIKHIAKENWSKYITHKASTYWKKLTNRQRKQLIKRPLKIGSKVLVRDVSKTGITPNKLLTRTTGPWTVIGIAVSNNAYKLQNDQNGHIDYVGLQRIRLIKPTQLAPTGVFHLQSNEPDNQSPNL